MQENSIKSAQVIPTNNNNSNSSSSNSSGDGGGAATAGITSPSNANDIDQAQFEADKRAVYK